MWRDASWRSGYSDGSKGSPEDAPTLPSKLHPRVQGWSLELLEAYFTELPASAALALLRAPGLPKLRLKANVGEVGLMKRLALKMFGKRFTFGSAPDCSHHDGSPEPVHPKSAPPVGSPDTFLRKSESPVGLPVIGHPQIPIAVYAQSSVRDGSGNGILTREAPATYDA
ncbi:MAG TPA: hypothetical protein VJV79_22970 [Polyangiaceae bacterium]|nr:hypothetical protein [Polyangiaceae bacterium]